MAEPDRDDLDEQDQSEVFDEDNTNPQERGPGEDAEQLEDLVDVYDATARVGDDDDDEAAIGEDLDDDELVEAARDEDNDDDDLQDDDLVRREPYSFHQEDDIDDVTDVGDPDPDDVDKIDRRASDEVDLEYVGDLDDLEGAASAAQSLESAALSDRDLRELDYKDEYTRDDKDADAAPSEAG